MIVMEIKRQPFCCAVPFQHRLDKCDVNLQEYPNGSEGFLRSAFGWVSFQVFGGMGFGGIPVCFFERWLMGGGRGGA